MSDRPCQNKKNKKNIVDRIGPHWVNGPPLPGMPDGQSTPAKDQEDDEEINDEDGEGYLVGFRGC